MRGLQGVKSPPPAAAAPPASPSAAPTAAKEDEGRELAPEDKTAVVRVPWGGAAPGSAARRPSAAGLAASQEAMLARTLQDRAVGVPSCVVGGQGVGKTVVARALASTLGYGRRRTRQLFCFADMSARDRLQRRSTTPSGDTVWMDSAV